jgi:hypothetical protein
MSAEIVRKVTLLRRSGMAFVNAYGSRYPDLSRRINELYTEGLLTEEAYLKWEEIAKEAIPIAERQSLCSFGKTRLGEAKLAIGMPIVRTVTLLVTLKDFQLPEGLTSLTGAGYTATITNKEGYVVMGGLPVAELDDEEDDDFDDEDDDFDDEDDDLDDEDDDLDEDEDEDDEDPELDEPLLAETGDGVKDPGAHDHGAVDPAQP